MEFLGNTARSQKIGTSERISSITNWESYDDDRNHAIIGLARKLLTKRLD